MDPILVKLAAGPVIEVGVLTVGRVLGVIKALGAEHFRHIVFGGDQPAGTLVSALMDEPERAADALAVALDLDVEAVKAMLPDDFLALAFALVEVNADFFSQRIAPQIPALIDRLAQRLGSMSSSGSSSTDTPAEM